MLVEGVDAVSMTDIRVLFQLFLIHEEKVLQIYREEKVNLLSFSEIIVEKTIHNLDVDSSVMSRVVVAQIAIIISQVNTEMDSMK